MNPGMLHLCGWQWKSLRQPDVLEDAFGSTVDGTYSLFHYHNAPGKNALNQSDGSSTLEI